MSDDADMIGGQPLGVEELRRIAFGGQVNERVPREVALLLLGRKDYAQKVSDFERVLADEGEELSLRTAAAVELGRTGTEEAFEALVRHSEVKQELVARGVLNGLRRLRSPRALEVAARRAEEPRGGAAARSALARSEKWTAALVAFRQGAGAFDLDLPKRHRYVQVDPERAQEIRVTPASPETLNKGLQELSANSIGIELAREHAIEMRCGDRELVFFFNRELVGQDLARLVGRKAVAGLVAVRYLVEGDAYATKYAVLLQPSGGKELRVLVTTTNGALILAGPGRLGVGEVKFRLKSVDRPGVVAMEMEGAYIAEGLRIGRAVSELRRRRPQLVPQLRKHNA